MSSTPNLKLLPAYSGAMSIGEAIQIPRAANVLWLEILVNDQIDLSAWNDDSTIQAAHTKACRWYTAYRRVLEAILPRSPLPVDHGPIDFREYRTFSEALRFVSTCS